MTCVRGGLRSLHRLAHDLAWAVVAIASNSNATTFMVQAVLSAGINGGVRGVGAAAIGIRRFQKITAIAIKLFSSPDPRVISASSPTPRVQGTKNMYPGQQGPPPGGGMRFGQQVPPQQGGMYPGQQQPVARPTFRGTPDCNKNYALKCSLRITHYALLPCDPIDRSRRPPPYR